MGVSLIGHNSSNPRIGRLHLTHSGKASHSKWGYKLLGNYNFVGTKTVITN